MIPTDVKRPRNVDWKRAAAILYGDWGTSKAYVIGLAFAVAGYASFWLIAAMCVLTALVGLNYMVICRLYPDGGGVYAAVKITLQQVTPPSAFASSLASTTRTSKFFSSANSTASSTETSWAAPGQLTERNNNTLSVRLIN